MLSTVSKIRASERGDMAKVYNFSDDSDDEEEDDDNPVNSLRGKFGVADNESDDGEIEEVLIKNKNDASINASKDIIVRDILIFFILRNFSSLY